MASSGPAGLGAAGISVRMVLLLGREPTSRATRELAPNLLKCLRQVTLQPGQAATRRRAVAGPHHPVARGRASTGPAPSMAPRRLTAPGAGRRARGGPAVPPQPRPSRRERAGTPSSTAATSSASAVSFRCAAQADLTAPLLLGAPGSTAPTPQARSGRSRRTDVRRTPVFQLAAEGGGAPPGRAPSAR